MWLFLLFACSTAPPNPGPGSDNGKKDRPVLDCDGTPCVVRPAPPADPAKGLTPYVVPVPDYIEPMPVPADNPLTHAGVSLGRFLFYDPLLSGNNAQACAGCHLQSLAFTDGRKVSIGAEGRPVARNAMSLVNLAWTAPYFWDGRVDTLEALVPQPIQHPDELNQPMPALLAELRAHPDYPARFEAAFPGEGISSATLSKAIAQFLRTLVSFNSRADLLDSGAIELSALERRGNELMVAGLPKDAPDRVQDICDACHKHSAGVVGGASEMGMFTINAYRSNGLPGVDVDPGLSTLSGKPDDAGRFDVPTIRNLGMTAPYMHDGRFASLMDVMEHYNTQMERHPGLVEPLVSKDGAVRRMNLDEDDKRALAAMLGVFDDPLFVKNPAYSSPF